jgi:cyclophilin family peptidyl-prolyl cis-trans isomerase
VLAQLTDGYPEDIRIIYRHFPLTSIHDKAALATQVSEAAGIQGMFWEMHDLLYERTDEWKSLSEEGFQEWAVMRADELGMDTDQFTRDMNSDALVALAQDAWKINSTNGLPGTPLLVIDGQVYNGNLNYANLSAIISSKLLEKRHFDSCPPMEIDPDKQYIAILETEKGDITIELYADKSPLAVNNFVFLANQGWYDNVTFHRVLPNFVAQAGDPSGSGFGGPGYIFDNEISDDLKFDAAGILAMANSGPDTNGSQFFITYAPASNLDGGYTIFGRVISGMDVVESLTARDPSLSPNLPPGDLILSVKIEEK